jgi:hypothetical protein
VMLIDVQRWRNRGAPPSVLPPLDGCDLLGRQLFAYTTTPTLLANSHVKVTVSEHQPTVLLENWSVCGQFAGINATILTRCEIDRPI